MKVYVFYWLDGQKSISKGETVADAFTRAGYGRGAMAALDFYSEDKGDTSYWNRDERKWVDRIDNGTIEPFVEGLITERQYLHEQFTKMMKSHRRVAYELPNKDQVSISLELGEFFNIGPVLYLYVVYGQYNEGPYHDDGPESCHYMASLGGYFPPANTEDAVNCTVDMCIDIVIAMDKDNNCKTLESIAASQ